MFAWLRNDRCPHKFCIFTRCRPLHIHTGRTEPRQKRTSSLSRRPNRSVSPHHAPISEFSLSAACMARPANTAMHVWFQYVDPSVRSGLGHIHSLPLSTRPSDILCIWLSPIWSVGFHRTTLSFFIHHPLCLNLSLTLKAGAVSGLQTQFDLPLLQTEVSNKALFRACMSGSRDLVTSLVVAGVDVNAKDEVRGWCEITRGGCWVNTSRSLNAGSCE